MRGGGAFHEGTNSKPPVWCVRPFPSEVYYAKWYFILNRMRSFTAGLFINTKSTEVLNFPSYAQFIRPTGNAFSTVQCVCRHGSTDDTGNRASHAYFTLLELVCTKIITILSGSGFTTLPTASSLFRSFKRDACISVVAGRIYALDISSHTRPYTCPGSRLTLPYSRTFAMDHQILVCILRRCLLG